MWPLPPIRDGVVSLVLEPTKMHCGWLERNAKKELRLRAFTSYPLESAMHCAILHNTHDFIKQYTFAHSFLVVALASPLIHEELVRLSKASPIPQDFQLKKFQHLLWDHQYLHALDDGNHLFYVKGIQKPHYFEYQLLAHELNLKLVTITSNYAAQLNAYAYMQGKAFRQAKLSIDLAKHNYDIAACLDRDTLARMLRVNADMNHVYQYPEILCVMVGSYYMEQRNRS